VLLSLPQRTSLTSITIQNPINGHLNPGMKHNEHIHIRRISQTDTITNGGDKFEVCIRQWERMLPRVDEAYDQKSRGVLVMRSRFTSHATASESHTETQLSQNNASNLPHRVFSLRSQSIPLIRNLFRFHRRELFTEHLPGVSRLRDTCANRRQPINSSGPRKLRMFLQGLS